MITRANKSKWAQRIFQLYIHWLLGQHFHSMQVLGNVPQTDARFPVLLLPNHSTWWDGFFVFLLNERIFKRPIFLMMLEKQLRRYRFFARLGAFGIDPANAKLSLQALKYTLSLFEMPAPKPLVCIFPQGELLPWHSRPLRLKPGVEWLVRKYPDQLNLVLLAMRCEYGAEQRAKVIFKMSENRVVSGATFPDLNALQAEMEKLLSEVSENLAQGEEGQMLFSGRNSVNVVTEKINIFKKIGTSKR